MVAEANSSIFVDRMNGLNRLEDLNAFERHLDSSTNLNLTK